MFHWLGRLFYRLCYRGRRKPAWRVYEVPISYSGRTYEEGKKIGLRDAFNAFWCIVRYRYFD